MKTKASRRIFSCSLIAICLFVVAYLLYDRGRPAPISKKEELFKGVTYYRDVRYYPRPMIAHIMVISARRKGLKFLVTPPDAKGDMPLVARKTSEFLTEFDAQIAINGDGFVPWWSHSPLDYYPHVGDPVTPLGFTASRGDVYAYDSVEDVGLEPTIYFGSKNHLNFNIKPKNIYNALSGDRMLVFNGEPVVGLGDEELDPRTAIGIDESGRHLILVVVDGRQPFYSMGATFAELANLLIEYGAYEGMNLDGGGSSTMVIEGEDGKPVILNSPIDNYIPGRERPVANHLGIYLPK
jgi:hypothetical protein